MAYSKIIITQSGVPGAAGVSRNDLVTSSAVTFTNDADGSLDVTLWEWVLIEKPPGSAVTLSGGATSTASFTPDVAGRYVVSLRVNGLSNYTNGYSEIVAAAPYVSIGTDYNSEELCEYSPPAAHEKFLANWSGNTKGAQPEIYRIHKDIRTIIVPSIMLGGMGPRIPISLPGSLTQSTNSGTQQIAGYAPVFDMSYLSWVAEAFWYFSLGRNGAAGTATIELYDQTHSVALDFFNVSAAYAHVPFRALTIGSNPGDLRNDGPAQYTIRVYMSAGGGGADLAEVYDAGFIFSLIGGGGSPPPPIS